MKQTQEGCAHSRGRKTTINAARTLLLLAHLTVSRAAEVLLRLEWSGCWGFSSAPGGPEIFCRGPGAGGWRPFRQRGSMRKSPRAGVKVLAGFGIHGQEECRSGWGGSRESGRTCSWPPEASGSLVGRRSSHPDSSTGMAQSGPFVLMGRRGDTGQRERFWFWNTGVDRCFICLNSQGEGDTISKSLVSLNTSV